ncbi:MAG: endonuclease V [Terricaulis sp.]
MRRNSYRLGKHSSSYYLGRYDDTALQVDRDSAFSIVRSDDPDREFEVHLPVEWGEVRADLKPVARALLSRIVELDDIVRASHGDAHDDDERLAVVIVREFYCELRYFATAWNSDWTEYFTRDADGEWRHRGKALPWMRDWRVESEPALVAIDAAYGEARSAVSAVYFRDWGSEFTHVTSSFIREGEPPAYEPGAFYKRELPLLMEALDRAPMPVSAVVIDGYVWLSADSKPGLGARLYEALARRVPVIGVAKTAFRDDSWSETVRRGTSDVPLHVTSIGIDRADAARRIVGMSGEGRISKLVGLADRQARSALAS